MRSTVAIATLSVLFAAQASARPGQAGPPPFGLRLTHLASIGTDASPGTTGAEIVAYDTRTRRAFAINSTDNQLAVIDLKDPAAPVLLEKVGFAAYGAGLNSVDVHDGLVAVAVEASPVTANGRVVFLDAQTLLPLGDVEVGALPDMLTFDDDGERVLVANEGEAPSYAAGAPNPEGSISIIDLGQGVANATVRTAGFGAFDKTELVNAGVRIFGPGASVAQDLEPEYITLQGRTAWVTLQEANAVAVLDIPTATVTQIVPLGLKNHLVGGQGLDPSDRDGPNNGAEVKIGTWQVSGMYQPDAIAHFRIGPQRFLVTANEGDARDFPGFNEELRVGSSAYRLDPTAFPKAADLKTNAQLGRLTVSRATGDLDGDGDFDRIDAFGARSISIWSETGALVWDSGDDLERYFEDAANGWRGLFNANHSLPDGNAFDNRSDNKGPEPEGVAVGKVSGRTFAFVGLERIGGVMAFDVTDPGAPTIAAYANTRSKTVYAGDQGAEGVEFVSADDSPNGRPLVLVGNEVSRTVSIFQVDRVR
jgi:DNA-binding beta-propeller fold protein YncE